MTNIRYIKRNRHYRKNHGGDSIGENGRTENKSFYQNIFFDTLNGEKRKEESNYRKWNQLNFK